MSYRPLTYLCFDRNFCTQKQLMQVILNDREVATLLIQNCTILTNIPVKEDKEKRKPAIIMSVYISSVSHTILFCHLLLLTSIQCILRFRTGPTRYLIQQLPLSWGMISQFIFRILIESYTKWFVAPIEQKLIRDQLSEHIFKKLDALGGIL